ncbi:hypothetical protein, partial [Mycobacterium tuberculosis]|uniref:hypothetical protein n=2 Tax=Mycobacterium tuberculosis TaxID=1773 RepID=UPI0019D42F9D
VLMLLYFNAIQLRPGAHGSSGWSVGVMCMPLLLHPVSLYPQVCRLALLRQEGVDHARTEVGRLGDIDGDRSNRGPHRK